jgi:hypothetical protein
MTSDPATPVDEVAALVRDVRTLARRVGREDIGERVSTEARRVRDAEVAVTFAGLGGSGKSALVNALAGRAVVPEGLPTAVPTLVRPGPDAAVVHLATGPRIEALTLEEAWAWIGNASHDPRHVAVAVEVWASGTELPTNLLIIDTPALPVGRPSATGIADVISWRTDAVVFATSAAAPLDVTEMEFLKRIETATAHVSVAVTRTDRHRGWREICTDDTELLRGGVPRAHASVFGVSARLRSTAGRADAQDFDEELAAESGVPQLLEHLKTGIVGRQDDVRRTNLLRHCEAAIDEVELALQQVRAAIADGEDAVVRSLKSDAEKVRLAGDEAQLLLRDGFASLREAATNEIARMTRAAAAAVKSATSVDAIDEHVENVADALGGVADEFEQRCGLLIETAEATRLGSEGGAAVVADLARYAYRGEGSSTADDDSDSADPLRYRLARTAASGGVGLALTAQRLVGGGDVVSALLAVGTLVGAATGVFAIRAAKRSQDLNGARRAATAAIEDARLEAVARLRQRTLVRQREAEAALKQQIRLQLNALQSQLDEAAKAARSDAATRSRASAAAAAELERAAALRQRATALADAERLQRSKP